MINIKPDAAIDPNQQIVINKILPFTDGYNLTITRGHSSPIEQLNLIKKFSKECGLNFLEIDNEPWNELIFPFGKINVYPFQQSWSMLLNMSYKSNGTKGKIINPPIPATCLFDYVSNGVNKIGQIINPSPHIKDIKDPHPCPLDFSGNIDGKPNLNLVVSILNKAKAAGVGIKNITVEPANNCAHCDLIF